MILMNPIGTGNCFQFNTEISLAPGEISFKCNDVTAVKIEKLLARSRNIIATRTPNGIKIEFYNPINYL